MSEKKVPLLLHMGVRDKPLGTPAFVKFLILYYYFHLSCYIFAGSLILPMRLHGGYEIIFGLEINPAHVLPKNNVIIR